MSEENTHPENEKSASDMLHEIKIGTLAPNLLSKEQRQACVEALQFEGASPLAIAQFLNVSDRTIRRDIAEIRERNALAPNPDWVRETVGEFLLGMRINRAYLMKLSRNTDGSIGERAQSEYYAYMALSDMITKLQSLGYLPKSADALVLMQKKEEFESAASLAGLCTDIDDMLAINDDPAKAKKLLELKETIIQEGRADEPKKG